jgi:hypothetical protein
MLLPYRYKLPGIILITSGLILSSMFFITDFRIEIPVFAIISSFAETRFFVTFRTNFSDEIILLVLIAGFSLVAFSKEKEEDDLICELRYKALVNTVIINIIFLVIMILFIYGTGFISVMVFDIILPFIIYLCIFNYFKYKVKQGRKHTLN